MRLICACCAAVAACVFTAGAPATQAKPRTSSSRYVSSASASTAYDQGCAQGQADAQAPAQSSEVVLDFGGQNAANTGSILTNGTIVSFAQIQVVAEQFAYGYYLCTASDTSSILDLALGTNNSAYQVSGTGGAAWAASVVGPVRSWLTAHGADAQVTAIGANDMEPGFSANVTGTRAWVTAYSNANRGRLVNYGSADGCPQSSSANGSCSNGWRQADVWYVSWGAPAAFALPEIYVRAQSAQWTMISRYGATAQSGQVFFDGPLTTSPSYYSPADAWTRLWSDLNASPDTAQSLLYSSNI
jgi:hypothetical protein